MKEDKKIQEQPVEETITLKKDTVEALVSKVQALEDRLKRAEYAADKSRVARYDENNNKEKKEKKVGLSKYNDKIVVSWSDMKVNICEKTGSNGSYYEKLVTEITYEDDTKEEVDWLQWQRHRTRIYGVVTSETKNKDGDIWTIEIEGRELTINRKFLNS